MAAADGEGDVYADAAANGLADGAADGAAHGAADAAADGAADGAAAAVEEDVAGPFDLERSIEHLKATKKKLKREQLELTKKLKNEQQKRSRLLKAARNLSKDDLAFLLAKKSA